MSRLGKPSLPLRFGTLNRELSSNRSTPYDSGAWWGRSVQTSRLFLRGGFSFLAWEFPGQEVVAVADG